MSSSNYLAYKKNIGAAVKQLRKARGLKQKDLAASLNITANYLSLLENGKRGISISQLTELADVLEVPTTLITAMAEPSNGDQARDKLMKQIQKLIKDAVDADRKLKALSEKRA